MDEGIVPVQNSMANNIGARNNQFSIKVGLAQRLQGGVIVEVTNEDQAKTAEEAGACCIIIHHGTSCMPHPSLVRKIKQAVSVPIIARVRIGHFVEAQILEAIGVDYIDESELLDSFARDYINKHNYRVPFACGCGNLDEALSRVREGAAIIWMGGISMWNRRRLCNIGQTVQTVASIIDKTRELIKENEDDDVFALSRKMAAPYDLVAQIKCNGRLPVVQFAAGGILTPADAALMMQLGCDGVFVGSEIFNRPDPSMRIRGIVQAVGHYNDPYVLAEISSGFNDADEPRMTTPGLWRRDEWLDFDP